MNLSQKIVGIGLAAITMSAVAGVALQSGNVFHLTKAETNYTTVVNAQVEVEGNTYTLGYNTSGSYMVNENPSFFTISWNSSNTHFTLKYEDTNLGVIDSNKFGTSATLWTIKNNCVYANDGTNDREIQWNNASNGLRAAPYKHNDNYPAVYLFTADKLTDWCSRCNGSQFAFECLYNLLTTEEKSEFNVEGTGYTLPEEQQEETGTEVTFKPTTELTDTDGHVTWTNSSNYGATVTTELRIYKGQTLTITGTGCKVLKAVFTCTAQNTSKYGPGCFTTESCYTYSGYIGTWIGNADSVIFTASTNQVRITQIVITYK